MAGFPGYQIAANGTGFDMHYAQKLFAPFRRLHSANEYPGLGVGLATVRSIIRRHGDSADVDATPGLGSQFRFTLRPNASAQVFVDGVALGERHRPAATRHLGTAMRGC